MLRSIKEKGRRQQLDIKPSFVVRIGLQLMNHLDVKEIYRNDQNISNYYLQKGSSKSSSGKTVTFLLDSHSRALMDEILDQALENKIVLTLSIILRTSIKCVAQLNEKSLSKNYREFFVSKIFSK